MEDDSNKRKKLELKTLKPKKHNQLELFIADNFNLASFRDDITTMEHPFFALKAGDIKDRIYKNGNVTVKVMPTSAGIATIFDKDIWIYCISKLRQAIYEGEEVSPTIRFTVYDFLVNTNRETGGKNYRDFTKSLERLQGTTITTNIYIDDDNEEFNTFGLIDGTKAIKTKKNTMEVTEVEITLPNWLFEKIVNPQYVLKINPDYFRIRKAIDRRIYEIARKHCGNQKEFKIGLESLYKKAGSSASLREFKRMLKKLSELNDLPDYEIEYLAETDNVLIFNRNHDCDTNQKVEIKLQAKEKRLLIEQYQKTLITTNNVIEKSVINILNFININFPDKKYPIFKTKILTKKKLTEYLRKFDEKHIIQKILEFIDFDFTKNCNKPEAYFYRILEKKY